MKTIRYVDFSGKKKINSLSECVEIINSLNNEWNITKDKSLWYRGQACCSWKLIPSLYRYKDGHNFEREIVRDFKLHAIPYLKRIPNNEIEWLTIMQHYGLPTRLLDWTESYLIALFFAVSDDKKEDAALWIIRPAYLNKKIITRHSIPIETDLILQKYVLPNPDKRIRTVEAEFPMAFRPSWNNPRITTQKGTFTIHGNQQRELESVLQSIYDDSKYMQGLKFTIPGDRKQIIMKELNRAGISELTLFPEIDGLCKELKTKYL